MKYFCYQGNNSDCGFASLKMLLATLNDNESYLYLLKGNKKDHFSFYDLVNIAKANGVILKAYRYQTSEVNELKPCLAMINANHLVFVKSLKRGVYTIYDPSVGIYKMKSSKFDKIWTGEVLEVVEFNPTPFEKRKFDILPHKFNVVSALISLIGVLSLLAGFFFVKKDSYFFIPIIFIVIFSICELVDNWYLIKEIKFFDKKYIPLFFSKRNEPVKDTYKRYIEFKEIYFSFARKFSNAIITCSLIAVVLIINDPLNSILCMGLLLLAIIERLLFGKKDEESKASITQTENTLLNNDNENLIEDIAMINQTANTQGLNFSVRKCINTFIILLFAFTMMILSKNLGVNFIIFHFVAYYYFFINGDVILKVGDLKKQFDMSKARFLDTCNL